MEILIFETSHFSQQMPVQRQMLDETAGRYAALTSFLAEGKLSSEGQEEHPDILVSFLLSSL
jgi:hypothetical protein